MTTASNVVNLSIGEIGYGETSGNNITKYGTWYYGLQDQWCGMFVSYIFFHAGLPLSITTDKGFSYCPSAVSWFKGQSRWIDKSGTPLPGDVVFYDWHPGTSESDAWHVGIVEKIEASGQVTCIDGNYGPYPARVERHRHSMSNIFGYGRPPYDGSPVLVVPPWPGRYVTLSTPLSYGQDILTWQKQMISVGWDLGPTGPSGKGDDGYFGMVSFEKLKEFQSSKGIEVDGILGPESWNAVFRSA